MYICIIRSSSYIDREMAETRLWRESLYANHVCVGFLYERQVRIKQLLFGVVRYFPFHLSSEIRLRLFVRCGRGPGLWAYRDEISA